jgi:hypothetical protein
MYRVALALFNELAVPSNSKVQSRSKTQEEGRPRSILAYLTDFWYVKSPDFSLLRLKKSFGVSTYRKRDVISSDLIFSGFEPVSM